MGLKRLFGRETRWWTPTPKRPFPPEEKPSCMNYHTHNAAIDRGEPTEFARFPNTWKKTIREFFQIVIRKFSPFVGSADPFPFLSTIPFARHAFMKDSSVRLSSEFRLFSPRLSGTISNVSNGSGGRHRRPNLAIMKNPCKTVQRNP